MTPAPTYLKSLKKESVVQSVINQLTDAIRNGDLKPGDKIPPSERLREYDHIPWQLQSSIKTDTSIQSSCRTNGAAAFFIPGKQVIRHMSDHLDG